MQKFPYEIEYYVSKEGTRPFKDWLDSLKDITARAKIRVRLDRVRLGNFGNNRNIGEGVHELKINYGPGYRVYFGLESTRIVLLLTGGDKSAQRKDIVKAKEFWQDHQRRKQRG